MYGNKMCVLQSWQMPRKEQMINKIGLTPKILMGALGCGMLLTVAGCKGTKNNNHATYINDMNRSAKMEELARMTNEAKTNYQKGILNAQEFLNKMNSLETEVKTLNGIN
jgi:outer membrane murein-binding lipoprotein Lpp